jgi:hypothetical protein
MKTLKLIVQELYFLLATATQAQVSVNNLGNPPSWVQLVYSSVDYLPDIEAYYDIRATQFIYLWWRKMDSFKNS